MIMIMATQTDLPVLSCASKRSHEQSPRDATLPLAVNEL